MAGPIPHPKRRLNPEFREATRAAMRVGRPSGQVLALVAGFSYQTTFSTLLNAVAIPATPLTIARFERVARCVNFVGDIFLSEAEA